MEIMHSVVVQRWKVEKVANAQKLYLQR